MSLRFCFNCNFLQQYFQISFLQIFLRDGSRTAATSKMECLVIIVNLPAVTYYHKALPAVYYYHKALHLAASLDPPLLVINSCLHIALFLPLRSWPVSQNLDLIGRDTTVTSLWVGKHFCRTRIRWLGMVIWNNTILNHFRSLNIFS